MSETKELLRRGVGEFEPMPDAFGRVLARRDRKRRNQRIAAGILGIAVFAFAAIGFVRLLGSERGPIIGPATTPLTERFDSPLHGLSIGHPSGWRTRAATDPWGHGEIAFGAPDVDVIFDPTLRDDLYLALVSEPLGAKSATEWVDAHWMQLPSVGICGGGGGGGRDSLDGAVDGWFEYCGERHGAARGNVAIVATATRGYIIYLHVGDERLLQATYDWDWFEQVVLKTVDLHPEDALDASNPSASP